MKKFSDLTPTDENVAVLQEEPQTVTVEAPVVEDIKKEEEIPPEQAEEVKPEIPEHMINDPQAIGYPDLQTQEDIYRNTAFGILSGEPESILDVGCGRGDFGHYVRSVISSDISYTGIDTNELLIQAGHQKYDDAILTGKGKFKLNRSFFDVNLQTNEGTRYDWIFHITNLTVNYGYITPFDKYDYLEQIIDKTISESIKGSVFVLLNDHNATETYVHYNIGAVASMMHNRGMKFAIDNSDFPNMFKLIIFNNPF